uniref:NADH dehydrogenase subunit 6 n=1 Tax=Pollicipes pollicipes TaxID=41117 RepID=UPI00243521DB|nr:NADH dehydrogenase subunit 6 [Pollicipes pollicipes]WEW79657.1 NADH dehydrogenase subunit 6 [Pollicipes pollicipes]
MLNSILYLVFFMNLIFMFMFHPLAMILILIIQSTMISILVYTLTQFPWFSYTLILIFLGGMLILFTYMSNIASNEMFKPNLKMALPVLFTPAIYFILPEETQNLTMESQNMEDIIFTNFMIFKPYTITIMPITLLMAAHIILTLLVVVKISKMSQGPLRII